jgi:hypothetical protein
MGTLRGGEDRVQKALLNRGALVILTLTCLVGIPWMREKNQLLKAEEERNFTPRD